MNIQRPNKFEIILRRNSEERVYDSASLAEKIQKLSLGALMMYRDWTLSVRHRETKKEVELSHEEITNFPKMQEKLRGLEKLEM